jgi:hypothetical protein
MVLFQFYSVNLNIIINLIKVNYYLPVTIYYSHDYFLKIK